METFVAQKLTLGYNTLPIIEGLDLNILPGQITTLVGPNGCGKSTLLRGLARLMKPQGGAVLLDGAAIHSLPTKELAKEIGILPQSPIAPEGLTVRELVAQGRYPHQQWFQQWNPADEVALQRALELTGLVDLSERWVDTLSGGQRQRAWIAMTLAQETNTILLDEPTTFLDLAHQMEVLDLLTKLNAEGKTIIIVLHDLNHAARCADHIVALCAGKIIAQGSPEQVINEHIVREIFGVHCCVIRHPVTGLPLCLPLNRIPAAELQVA
jgi:iron complex transport system ATP-binding protein